MQGLVKGEKFCFRNLDFYFRHKENTSPASQKSKDLNKVLLLYKTLPYLLKNQAPPFGPWQTLSVLRPTCGATVFLHGPAVILCSMTSIWSNVHDILHVQHQFFEVFISVLGFPRGKIHFFPKVLKNWSSCQKTEPKVIIITYFFILP